jgi:hypothetical protein
MSLYYENRKGKIILMLLGAVILIATLLYSNYLASNLKKNEEKNIFIFTEALQRQVSNARYIPDASVVEGEYSDFLVTIVNTFPLPVVYEDEKGELTGQNFTPDDRNYNKDFLEGKKWNFYHPESNP